MSSPEDESPDLKRLLSPHPPVRARNHRWILNVTGRVAPSDVRSALEKERDHYAKTTLVAGPDPREPGQVLMVHEWEFVIDHMTRAIQGAASLAALESEPLFVTVHGWTRLNPPSDKPGSVTQISVSVANKEDPEPFYD